jgi:hypothetical protein
MEELRHPAIGVNGKVEVHGDDARIRDGSRKATAEAQALIRFPCRSAIVTFRSTSRCVAALASKAPVTGRSASVARRRTPAARGAAARGATSSGFGSAGRTGVVGRRLVGIVPAADEKSGGDDERCEHGLRA